MKLSLKAVAAISAAVMALSAGTFSAAAVENEGNVGEKSQNLNVISADFSDKSANTKTDTLADKDIPQQEEEQELTETFNKNAAYVKSGTCGATATWGLAADGTLYIEGSGAMDNYSDNKNQPWYRNPSIISDDPYITRVVVGPGITSIGKRAFEGIDTLESVSLAEGGQLQLIEAYAFYKCNNMTSINFPYGINSINEQAFRYCESLKQIVLPDSLSYVGYAAFGYCYSLERISIPVVDVNYDFNGEYRGNFPFDECTSLKYCTLTGTGDMKGSNYSPIQYTNITTLTISDTITSLYGALAYDCDYLNTVTLPDGITSIPHHCFYDCALTSISIPDSVTSIGESAFSSLCGDGLGEDSNRFTTLILPNNLTSIERKAFAGCELLSTLVVPKSLTSIGNDAFMGCDQLKHIHIPDGRTAEQYINTPLPDNTAYYYHFNADGTCPAGNTCPIAYERIQQNKRKNAEAFVERLYVNILGRASDPKGKADHVNRLMAGQSACDVAKGFVLSPEIKNKKLSNEEYVTRMYKTMLNRNPDPTGLANWTKALDNGCSYGYILQGFCGASEFTNLCASYGLTRGTYKSPEYRDYNANLTAYVSRMYTVAMGRSYDVGGLNNHTRNYINGTKTAEGIAHDFIFSPEFKQKNLSDEEFVECMYNTLFGRKSDAAGKNKWLAQMKNGVDREGVFKGFTGAQEFKNMVAGFDI